MKHKFMAKNNRKMAWLQMLIRDRFSSKEIALAIGVSSVQGNNIIRHFLENDLIKIVWGTGAAGNPRLMRVVLNAQYKWGSGGNVSYDHKKNGRQTLWNGMKILRQFTVEGLLNSLDLKQSSAQEYVKALTDSGYLILRRSGKHQKGLHNGHNIYTLVRDTGRLAPKLMKNGCWDQNEKTLNLFCEIGNDYVA